MYKNYIHIIYYLQQTCLSSVPLLWKILIYPASCFWTVAIHWNILNFLFPSLSLGATFICSRVYWTVVDQIVFIFSFNFLLVLLCSWVIFNFCHTRVERLLCFHLFALGFLPHSLGFFSFYFFAFILFYTHIFYFCCALVVSLERVCVCVCVASGDGVCNFITSILSQRFQCVMQQNIL